MGEKINPIKFWLNVGRFHALPQSIMPYLLGCVITLYYAKINFFLAFLGLMGVILAHLAFNILDDYFDYKNGHVKIRKEMINGGIRARAKKCFYIEENKTTWKKVLIFAFSLLLIACLSGIIISYFRGYKILIIPVIVAILGFFYSMKPFSLSYKGLGEIVIAIIFGPLILIGAALTSGGVLNNQIYFTSIIIGILVMNILYTHSIMDFNPDKAAGKKTFAILMGSEKNAFIFQSIMLLFVYFLTGLGIYLNIFPKILILTFLSSIIAIRLLLSMYNYIKNPDKLPIRAKFLDIPMEKYSLYQTLGIDWFIYRWFLARNLVTCYVILFIISYLLIM